MDELKLPEEISQPSISAPRDLVIISIPKAGKSVIFGKFTEERNAIVLDLEKGGYEYIAARKLTTYTSQDVSRWESFQNYIKCRDLLLANKGKYEYLLIDGLSDLDDLAEIGGTKAYMNTTIGKNFNRTKSGTTLEYTDPEWKSVLSLPEGAGYLHFRNWFMRQIEIFREVAPYRIYAAHLSDKYIKDNNREEVVGSEISLTGKLKTIFASRVTSLAKLIVDGDERYLNFDVQNDSVVAGSRAPHLKGRILISKLEKDGTISTFWNSIYGESK